MKKLIYTLLILFMASTAHATNWCEDADIIACWTLETGSGTTFYDQSDTGADSTGVDGDPSWSSTVPSGINSSWSVEFDGNDSIDFPEAYLEPTAPFTIVMWVYTTTDNARVELFTNEDIAKGYSLQFRGDQASDPIYFSIMNGGYPNGSATGVTKDTWHHVAASYIDDDPNGVKICIDGSCSLSGDMNGLTYGSVDTTMASYNSGSSRFLTGKIDDVAIFSRELSEEDINEIMDYGLIGEPQRVPTTTEVRNVTLRNVTIR